VNPVVGTAAIFVLLFLLFIVKRSRSGKPVWLYVLFFLSGFPALIYQIVWQRSLFAIYGVNIESVTVVITAFMLGLGLGSLFGGWISKHKTPRLLVFACVELGIAGFGFLSLPLFHWIAIYTAGTTIVKAGLISFLLVLIPTILMGSTLPLLVAHIVERSGNVGHSVGTLYFVNTLGSATACFAAGIILMRIFGQSGSVQIAAGVNACIGLSVLLLYVRSRRRSEASAEVVLHRAEASVDVGQEYVPLKIGLLLAALSGFVALGYEILWYRVLSFTSGGVARALALLLGTYLAGIAFGSFFTERLCHLRRHTSIRRFVGLTGALIVIANILGYFVIPYLAYRVPKYDLHDPFLLILLTTACFGAAFPLISHISIQPAPDSGAKLSYLYLGNIIGSASGSFVIGFILMDVWPLSKIAVALALTGVAVGTLLILRSPKAGVLRLTAALACVLSGTLIVISSRPLFTDLYEKLQYKQEWQQVGRFAHVVETKSGIVTVSQDGAVYGGGIYDGMFNVDLIHDSNHAIRAYALSALHPAPRQVLMIGLSSGSWAQIIANHPQVEKLTIVEINPGYLNLIPQYPQVASLLRNPKVEIVIDDGRRWLLRNADRRFDVIVMNTTFHWRDHVSNLLSTEFLRIVREHLNPGGLHFYNTTGSSEVLLTGATVFPYSLRVINFMAVSDSPIDVNKERWRKILLQYKIDGRPVFNLNRREDREQLEQVLSLADSTAPAPNQVVAMESGATFKERFRGRRIITDDNMGTEWFQ
jgi:spermidine synthase